MKNLIDQTIENKLVGDIKNLKGIVLKIRQKQFVGADIIQVVISNLVEATWTLIAGDLITFTNTVEVSDQHVTIWNLFRTLEANNNPVGTYKHWPEEQDDSAHVLGAVVRWEVSNDLQDSDDVTGKRVAHVIVVNNDSHTLDFRFRSKWYGIRQTL